MPRWAVDGRPCLHLGRGYFPRCSTPCCRESPAPQCCPEGVLLWGASKIWWQAGSVPWATGLCLYGPQEGMLAVMSGLGRLYREKVSLPPWCHVGGSSNSRSFFLWQRSTWFSCMLHSCNSPFGRDFWKENLLHSSVSPNLLLTVRHCHLPLED